MNQFEEIIAGRIKLNPDKPKEIMRPLCANPKNSRSAAKREKRMLNKSSTDDLPQILAAWQEWNKLKNQRLAGVHIDKAQIRIIRTQYHVAAKQLAAIRAKKREVPTFADLEKWLKERKEGLSESN